MKRYMSLDNNPFKNWGKLAKYIEYRRGFLEEVLRDKQADLYYNHIALGLKFELDSF